jgi:hydroxymethylpyrimidine pyrophosphatase-like HAD family hydrolase
MLGFDSEQVIVAGDSANDKDMFLYAFKGIIVANADAQLKSLSGSMLYHARKTHADGVLEGLQYWGVVPLDQGI